MHLGRNKAGAGRRANLHTLAERQGWRCCVCGVRMVEEVFAPASVTREHVIPRKFGGPNHPDNLVATCYTCNNAESAWLIWFAYCREAGLRLSCHLEAPLVAQHYG
jgi:5-methylcytosine-specific restriction endonuclease McrA